MFRAWGLSSPSAILPSPCITHMPDSITVLIWFPPGIQLQPTASEWWGWVSSACPSCPVLPRSMFFSIAAATNWVSQVAQNLPDNSGDLDLIPGSGRSPGEGHSNPLQYSCLENPMDRGAWWPIVHRVTKGWTWLKRLSTHATFSRKELKLRCGVKWEQAEVNANYSVWEIYVTTKN